MAEFDMNIFRWGCNSAANVTPCDVEFEKNYPLIYMKAKYVVCLFIVICGLLCSAPLALAQSTAFMYQGLLNAAALPANGNYDLRFGLYPTNSGGAAVANLITNADVPVSNGVFTVTVDFGDVFNGAPYWLEIGVRTNGSTNGFTLLSPRQEVTPSPYSLYSQAAGNVTGVLAVTNLPANVALLNGNANFTGALTASNFVGNGAGLTNLNPVNPTGSGAALTNLAYHVYNVRDYGAGNGLIGADSAAFRTVISLWMNNGGTIYLPPGDYYDTNIYNISLTTGDEPFLSMASINIIGAGSELTHWHFFGTNATWWTFQAAAAPQLVQGVTFVAGYGSGAFTGTGGTNNCFWDGGAQGHRLMTDVGFANWQGIACNFIGGGAAGDFRKVQFWYCGTGISLAGYDDDTIISAIGYNNTNTIIDLGEMSLVSGNTSTKAAQINIFGANNNRGVIVGNGAGCAVSGYIENTTNSVVTIGHPSGSDAGIQTVSIRDLGFLQYGDGRGPEVVCQIYTAPTLLTVRNVETSFTNILSMNSASDLSPIIFESAEIYGGIIMAFSDGRTIQNTVPVNHINITEDHWQKISGGLTGSFQETANSRSFTANNASLDTNGNLKVLGNLFGGKTLTTLGPGATYNVNAGIKFQSVYVNSSVVLAITNLALFPAANGANIDLLLYPGLGACSTTWPTNWLWENEAGTAIVPSSAAANTLMHVKLTVDVQPSVTNIVAHALTAPYATVLDTNAVNFFTAIHNHTNTLSSTQSNAVNTLVQNLKMYGLWSKADCIYPLIGSGSGTTNNAGTNSWSINLVNTNKYNIKWIGSVTFAATGVTGDGSTGYGDTSFNPTNATSPNYTQNSASLAAYVKTASPNVNGDFLGATDGARAALLYNGNFSMDGFNDTESGVNTYPYTSGLQLGTRTASTVQAAQSGTATYWMGDTSASTGVPNDDIFILCRNSGGPANYSSANLAFVWIGGALSSSDAANLTAVVTAFETALGRQ
jgi:hypothetical protein